MTVADQLHDDTDCFRIYLLQFYNKETKGTADHDQKAFGTKSEH